MLKTIAIAAALTCGMTSLSLAADLIIEDPGVVDVGMQSGSLLAGDIEGYVGLFRIDDFYNDEIYDGQMWGAAGRINIPLGDSFSAQLDLSGEMLSGVDYDYSVLDAAVHLSWRQDGYLLGVFGSLGQDQDWWDGKFGTVGAEALFTLDNIQMYGQVGYTTEIDGDDDVEAFYGRGELRYFLTPNLMASGSLGFVSEEYSGDDEIGGVNWGARLEYRFDDSPISLFAAYEGSYESEPDEDEDWAVHTVKVGAKFAFGTDSLQQAATQGATLRDFNPITGYGFQRYNDWE